MSRLKFTSPETPAKPRRVGATKAAVADKTLSSRPPRTHKTDTVIAMLQRPEGVTMHDLMAATSWQRHSVRGALAGVVRKKLGRPVSSELVDGVRRYRMTGADQ